MAVAPSKFTADERGTSSVFVGPIDNCPWQITSDPEAPLTTGEGAAYPRVLRLLEEAKGGGTRAAADFTLAFSATDRVIGVKPGCETP